MTLKLTHTTGVKRDGKKYTVYRLFEEGVLVGECCMSRKHKFIKYSDTTIEIRNLASWYESPDIRFVESGTETLVGIYHNPGHNNPLFSFLLNDEEWIVREMTPRELEARSASQYWGGHVISSGENKSVHCSFNYPPPSKEPLGRICRKSRNHRSQWKIPRTHTAELLRDGENSGIEK